MHVHYIKTYFSSLLPEILQTIGAWAADLKSENTNDILENYLLKSVDHFEKYSEDTRTKKAQAYISLAKFCDSQYKQISEYMKSKDFEDKQELMKKLQIESETIKNINRTRDREVSRGQALMERHTNIDMKEVETSNREKNKFLKLAITNYGKALAGGSDKHDLAVFRLISLWFSNHDMEINSLVNSVVVNIPSAKFVPLLYQLAARMTDQTKSFWQILAKLLTRCLKEHPFHAIPVLLALANAELDEKFDGDAKASRVASNGRSTPRSGRTSKETCSSSGSRSLLAKKLLIALKQNESAIVKTIEKMEQLCEALIGLAYVFVDPKSVQENKSFKVDRGQLLHKLDDLEDIPVITCPLKVKQDGRYGESIVGIAKYETSYTMVGGINAPKRINCRGTDGKLWPQLIKGNKHMETAIIWGVKH